MTRARITVERCPSLARSRGVQLVVALRTWFGEDCVKVKINNVIIIKPVDSIKLTQFMLSYNPSDYGWNISSIVTEEGDNDEYE